jgi:hypothetical protein
MIDAYGASIRAATALSDALDDRILFARHPERRFSGNDGLGLIHQPRQGADPDVYLRTFSATLTRKSDADGELAVLWYAGACPDWAIERCRKWVRKVRAQHCAHHGCNGRA